LAHNQVAEQSEQPAEKHLGRTEEFSRMLLGEDLGPYELHHAQRKSAQSWLLSRCTVRKSDKLHSLPLISSYFDHLASGFQMRFCYPAPNILPTTWSKVHWRE
jgi:hypothetical protein